jgi:hypothetical protein
MKTEKKYSFLVWAIVILAVMNLTTIITLLYHQHKAEKSDSVKVPEQLISENTSAKFSGRYFRDQLGLSSNQMARFAEFNPVFRQDVWSINLEMADIRRRMLIELAKEKSDTSRLYMLSDSIGYLHSELKKLTCRYYMDFKNICDNQQKGKLEQMFGEMFSTEIQSGQFGRRGPGGKGRGRRFDN